MRQEQKVHSLSCVYSFHLSQACLKFLRGLKEISFEFVICLKSLKDFQSQKKTLIFNSNLTNLFTFAPSSQQALLESNQEG